MDVLLGTVIGSALTSVILFFFKRNLNIKLKTNVSRERLFKRYKSDPGFDVKTPRNFKINPNEIVYVNTGIIPNNFSENVILLVLNRRNCDFLVFPFFVSGNEETEIVIKCFNPTIDELDISEGTRIATIVCVPIVDFTFV